MAETLQENGLWHIILAQKDLIEQAGLNKKNFQSDLGCFKYKERRVIMSHRFNEHLVVSMEGEDDEDMKKLMDGFSKVVGYIPFCKYILMPEDGSKAPLLPTYEWDNIKPDSRYKELYHKEKTLQLEKLV